MSRNLGRTDCNECPSPSVKLVESPRPITKEEAGVYFSEYSGMMVANAECPECEAKYLAWVSGPFCHHWREASQGLRGPAPAPTSLDITSPTDSLSNEPLVHSNNSPTAGGPVVGAGQTPSECSYSDLSYRSTFNDEPGAADLAVYEVVQHIRYERVRTIRRCPNGFDLDRGDHTKCRDCEHDAKKITAGERGLWSPCWFRENGEPAPFWSSFYSTREEAQTCVDQSTAHTRTAEYERRYGPCTTKYGVYQWGKS